jgi:hypothetical protein
VENGRGAAESRGTMSRGVAGTSRGQKRGRDGEVRDFLVSPAK